MNFDQSLRHNRRAEDLSDFFNSIRRKLPLIPAPREDAEKTQEVA